MDHEEQNLEIHLREIAFASEDLAEFLKWVALDDDLDQDDFEIIHTAVYAYARSKNPSIEGSAEEE